MSVQTSTFTTTFQPTFSTNIIHTYIHINTSMPSVYAQIVCDVTRNNYWENFHLFAISSLSSIPKFLILSPYFISSIHKIFTTSIPKLFQIHWWIKLSINKKIPKHINTIKIDWLYKFFTLQVLSCKIIFSYYFIFTLSGSIPDVTLPKSIGSLPKAKRTLYIYIYTYNYNKKHRTHTS